MKNFPRSQIIFLGIFLFLLLSLPVVLFLTTQRRHDIRPRAELTGVADLLLYPSNSTPLAGDVFDVVVSTQLTNENLRISGADFKVLYSKDLLEAVTVAPAVGGDKPFTDVLISEKEKVYDDQYNFLHVSEIAKKDDDKLAGGFVQLAAVKFRAKKEGSSAIKFPDNSELQIVGIDLGGSISPTPTPQTTVPTPTVTPSGPTLTPTPTSSVTTPTPTSGQPTFTPTPPPRLPTSTPTPVDANCSAACQAQGLPGGTCKRNSQGDEGDICLGDRLAFGCRWSPNYYCCCKNTCQAACQQSGYSGGACKPIFSPGTSPCGTDETDPGLLVCWQELPAASACCCSGGGTSPTPPYNCAAYCEANFLQGGTCKRQSEIEHGDICTVGSQYGCGGQYCCCQKPTCLGACQKLGYSQGACLDFGLPETCQGQLIGPTTCYPEYGGGNCCCTN